MNSYNQYGPASRNVPYSVHPGPHPQQSDPRLLTQYHVVHHQYRPQPPANMYPRPPTGPPQVATGFAQPGVGGFVPPPRLNSPGAGMAIQAPYHGARPHPPAAGPPHPYNQLQHIHSMPPFPPVDTGMRPLQNPRSLSSPPLPPKPTPTFHGWKSQTHPPTLPPKIPLYPQSVSQTIPIPIPAMLNPVSRRDQAQPIARSEDDELALAIALSTSETGKREALSGREDEELARAMEASLVTQQPRFHSPPSAQVTSNDYFSRPVGSEDIALSEARSTTSPDLTPSIDGDPPRSWTTSTPSSSQISEDEALARRLAAEEQLALMPERNVPGHDSTLPPQYVDPPSRPSSSLNIAATNPTRGLSPAPSSIPSPSPTPSSTFTNAAQIPVDPVSTNPSVRPTNMDGPSSSGRPLREVSTDTYYLNVPPKSSSIRPVSGNTSLLDGFATPSRTPSPQAPSASSRSSQPTGEVNEDLEPERPASTHAAPTVSSNQYIDGDLLLGVSLGFVDPSISTTLEPMQTPMPNVISLPFGRCPALHIMAPTWRHLLKLLARLSGTRVEPTMEAVAVTKVEMKLRIVIQFVKDHHLSSQWRTIIWLTIDNPPPPSVPNHWKYTNGDVNTLPWSYTLTNVPSVLRDATDSPTSKTYTIPSTASIPHPSLPISFPNMAMYLQSALEESRKAVGDSSGGLRKLAKMVELCYPSEPDSGGVEGLESAERMTVGGLFKRVIGRKIGNKGRGGNEDTYDLVTPFVPDEWG